MLPVADVKKKMCSLDSTHFTKRSLACIYMELTPLVELTSIFFHSVMADVIEISSDSSKEEYEEFLPEWDVVLTKHQASGGQTLVWAYSFLS